MTTGLGTRLTGAGASKSAKLLLDVCGSFGSAERCLSFLADQFEKSELIWTFETILKHSHDWVRKYERKSNGANARQRLFNAVAERRAKEGAEGKGKLTPAGEIFTGIRDLQIVQPNAGSDRGAQDRADGQVLPGLEEIGRQQQPGQGADDAGEDSSLGRLGA
jgi:hypothetical protein